MKRSIPILLGISCLMAVAGVRVNGQTKAGDFSSISKAEIEMLLTDVAKTNPKILEQLAKDPEMRQKQVENLKQLLAFASQAQRDGIAAEPNNRQELDSIGAETLAVNYDRELNKYKAKMPPFGYITDQQVKAYWASGAAIKQARETEFSNFLKAKIELLKADSPDMRDRELSEDERTQARDVFAKIRIYKTEYEQKVKAGKFPKAFIDKTNLQVKLQQAQFLSRLYSEKIADKTKVTDAEISKYIAEHPELDTTAKRAKAEQILKRATAGEDFAALANEFSEDPGNKNAAGEPQGGIYKDVPAGMMVPPFERAALALEAGQVAASVVESDFGFHIIKLEKKGQGKDTAGAPTLIYDVRHILIATTVENANGRAIPLKDFVRGKLETDREKLLIDEIVAKNNIQVPEDFTVPGADGETPKAVKNGPVKKKRPVKKRR